MKKLDDDYYEIIIRMESWKNNTYFICDLYTPKQAGVKKT